MAAQGYIGRAPGESSVIVARQTFTPTGITTNFTFASGYEIGYVDAYLNGARLIEGSDYTATDGSVVGLTTHAINGDVLELVAYKAFNLANVTGANGDFIIPDKIVHKEDTDTAIRFPQGDTFTVETAGSEVIRIDANGNVGIGTTNTLIAADAKNESVLNAGIITSNSVTATAGTFGTLNVSGTLTFEDVSNQNVVGFATFQKGIIVAGNGSTTTTLNVTGVSTMTGDVNFGAALNIVDAISHASDTNTKIRFPSNDTFTVETSGSERLRVDSLGEVRVGSAFSVSQAGVVTATAFFGSGSGLTGVASTDNINTSTLAQFTGGVGIADSIFHIGDSDTAIRFPAANTFAIETGGTEALRIGSDQKVYFGDFASAGSKAYIEKEVSGDFKLNIHASSSTSQNRIITFNSRDDVEALRIDASGRLLIGVTASRSVGTATAHKLQVEAVDATAGVTVTRCAASTAGPYLSFGKSRAASLGDNTVVQSGDSLGMIRFAGADGTDTQNVGASIQAFVDGTPGSNDMPGRIVLSTSADGANTVTERLRVDSSGRLLIGATSSAGNAILTVQGLAGNTTEQGILAIRRSSNNGNNAKIGVIEFSGGDNNQAAIIQAVGDNTWGTDDYPGRLEFYTTADGASTPTERLRIGSSGQIGIAGANFGTSGQVLTSNGSSSAVTWEDASSGGITTTKYSPTANAIIQIGLGTAQHHELTLTAGFTTVTTTGGAFGESHSLVLIQPSSGICTVGFSTFFQFPSGATPSMSEGGGTVDLISFIVKDIAGNTGTGATELLASAGLNYS